MPRGTGAAGGADADTGATAAGVLMLFEIHIHIIDDPIATAAIIIYILAESSTYAFVSTIVRMLCSDI